MHLITGFSTKNFQIKILNLTISWLQQYVVGNGHMIYWRSTINEFRYAVSKVLEIKSSTEKEGGRDIQAIT